MGLFTKAVMSLARGLGLRDPRLYAAVGAEPADSGERISVDGALAIDTVWACVRLISQTIATLPFQVFRDISPNRSEIARDHPLYKIIHDEPNADMTAVEFWTSMVACELLWGNAYARKLRGSQDQFIGLFPMRPDAVEVRVDPLGQKSYIYVIDGQKEEIPEEDVFHLKGFSVDGMMGLSPISLARQTLGNTRAAEKVEGSLYRNGMRPSGVFKSAVPIPANLREEARNSVEKYAGAMNSGKVVLLEGGWDFSVISIPPQDAQLLESRSFHVEQICRWYGVPPVLIGHTSKSSTQAPGMEQQMLFFYQTCLRDHLTRIERAVSTRLLSEKDRKKHYAEFNIDGLLRADSEGRARMYASLAQNGMRTRNELRALDNMPPEEGGDELTVQSNLVPLSMLGDLATNKTERGSPPSMSPDENATQPAMTGANIPG
jgi:HK97 family phage portal protein